MVLRGGYNSVRQADLCLLCCTSCVTTLQCNLHMKLHQLPVLDSPFHANVSTQRGEAPLLLLQGNQCEAVKVLLLKAVTGQNRARDSQIPVLVPAQPYPQVLRERHNALCYIKPLQAQALLGTHLMLTEENDAHLSCL